MNAAEAAAGHTDMKVRCMQVQIHQHVCKSDKERGLPATMYSQT